jgi:MFS family permease
MTPADLAHLVADPAAEQKKAARSAQDVLLPQDLLPGSSEAQMSLREGLVKTGYRTFLVLAIIVTLDNLQSSGLAVLAPNIQSSFHVSQSAVVFVTGISGGFLVLGIVPMGWLADRYRRGPIVGVATLAFGVMVAFTGFATNIFVFFLARLGAGVSQASTTVVHGSLLADTYPITLRGRIGAAMGIGTGAATALSPLLVGLIATEVGGANGWRWAFYSLSIPILVIAVIAFRIKEPPRGQFEKEGVLGEVISDTPPAAPSMEAAFERILRIRSIKAVLIAFSAIGFGLFTVPVLGARRPPVRREVLRPSLPGGSIEGALVDRQDHPPGGLFGTHSVLHAIACAVGGVCRHDQRVTALRLLHGRSGPDIGGALSTSRHGHRGGWPLRLLYRRLRRSGLVGLAGQSFRGAGGDSDDHDPVHHCGRLFHHPQCPLH